ncbi:Putative F-box/FBD/LRR-repeat protein At5g44950 [Linum perenne]
MKKQPKKSAAAAGKDLISELPDEILHSIIRRIACSKAAEQTIALSSRWRNLWRSYPVVQLNPKTTHDFYSIGSEVFQKFHDATMKRWKSWNLEFKGRKLEEFILWVSTRGLKRFELDADVDAGQSVVVNQTSVVFSNCPLRL